MAKTKTDAEGKPLATGWSGQYVWDIAMELVEGVPTGRLLDTACGGGYTTAQFAERGFEVVGTDLIADLWRFPQYHFCAADMDDPLPFQSEAFDVVCHIGALAHMENPSEIIRQLRRVLRSGGQLIITVENSLSLESRFRFLFSGTYRWYPHYKYRGQNKAELFLVNREPIRITTLMFILERLGFEIEEVRFGGKKKYFHALPLGLLFRLMTNLHNQIRKDKSKSTPAMVNSTPAFLCTHIGIRARKK